MKAWSETVMQNHLKNEALWLLKELSEKVHSGYDFNSDPEQMTLKVSNTLTNLDQHFVYWKRNYNKTP